MAGKARRLRAPADQHGRHPFDVTPAGPQAVGAAVQRVRESFVNNIGHFPASEGPCQLWFRESFTALRALAHRMFRWWKLPWLKQSTPPEESALRQGQPQTAW